ncbi:MAG: hypothetical protein U1F43_00355 [Myxococcota bacterium]
MRRLALAGLLAIVSTLASACRGPADDTLTPTKLPGFEMALPGWDAVSRGSRWMSDRVVLTDEPHERMLYVQWQPATELWTGPQLEAALDASKSAFGAAMTLGSATAREVSGHPGLTLPISIDDLKGRVTTWFCPEHQRQLLLFSLGPEAVHDAIVASVRCHTEKAPAGAADADKTLFPKFDPLPKMTKTEDGDPSMQTWTSDEAIIVLMAGTPGDTLSEVAGEGLQPTIKKMLALGGMTDVGAIQSSDVTDNDGIVRHIFRSKATSEGTPLDVSVAIWHCPASERSFIAIHAAGAGTLTGFTAEQHLLRASCP